MERRESQSEGGPWHQVADFKIKNPARPVVQPWVATATPTTNSADGLDLVLREVTVRTFPYLPHDIWDHEVTMPLEVWSNGMVLTNWSAPYVQAEDASGNWDPFGSHRSLDPRYVWKLEVDFEPEADLPEEDQATIRLPEPMATITNKVRNVPVTLFWDGYWMDASIPTNEPTLALRFVNAANDKGESACDASGSWYQYGFRRGSFMSRRGGVLTQDFKPTKVTVAVVPNVHATYYTQPRLVDQQRGD